MTNTTQKQLGSASHRALHCAKFKPAGAVVELSIFTPPCPVQQFRSEYFVYCWLEVTVASVSKRFRVSVGTMMGAAHTHKQGVVNWQVYG